MSSWNKGRGRGITWLRAHAGHQGKECLLWPFSRDDYGYGQLGHNGRVFKASRLMCELAHGNAPVGQEAAHNCGNRGCVNPTHLEWKTRSANQLDRRIHGTTVTSRWGPTGKLTRQQRQEIIALKGKKSHRAIARMYGMDRETIGGIHRSDPNKVNKLNPYQPEDDREVMKVITGEDTVENVAARLGRSVDGVYGRAARLRRRESKAAA